MNINVPGRFTENSKYSFGQWMKYALINRKLPSISLKRIKSKPENANILTNLNIGQNKPFL